MVQPLLFGFLTHPQNPYWKQSTKGRMEMPINSPISLKEGLSQSCWAWASYALVFQSRPDFVFQSGLNFVYILLDGFLKTHFFEI